MGYFYLLDLERTIGTGKAFFWNGNRHGYTQSLEHAGIFAQDVAEQIVADDFDKRTIMISQDVVFKILGKDMKQNEGNTIN